MQKTVASLLSVTLLITTQQPVIGVTHYEPALSTRTFLPTVLTHGRGLSIGNPTIIQRTPEIGEEIGAAGVEWIFDRPMNRASVEAAFDTSPDVAGSLTWKNDRTLVFHPSTPLPAGSTLDLQLGAGAKSQDGLPLRDAVRQRMRVADALAVSQVVPANGTENITPESDAPITVMFNRPVIALTPNGVANPPTPLSFDPPIAGKQEWLNTSTLVFRPNAPLPGGTRITAQVASFADAQGGRLADDFIWSFTTAAPKVLNININEKTYSYDPSGRKAVDADVSVVFNQDIDPASAQAAFALRKVSNGAAVTGAFLIRHDTLIFTPTQRLEFGNDYEAAMAAGVRSAGGGVQSTVGEKLRFSTVALPRLESITPRDGAAGVDPNQQVVLQFSSAIRASEVMSAVSISPAVSVDYPLSDYYATQIYLPIRLKPNTSYTVKVNAGLYDRYGNRTPSDMTSRFSTGDYPFQNPYATFILQNGNIATIDTLTPATLPVNTVNTTRLNMTLLQINRAQAAAAIESATRGDNSWRSAATTQRQWMHPLSTPRNETTTVNVSLSVNNTPLAAGLYAVEMTTPDMPTSQVAFVMVSPYHLTMKTEPAHVMLWANDVRTGQPVPNLPLLLRGNRVATNDDGIAIFPAPTDDTVNVVVAASDAAFAAVSSNWSVYAATASDGHGSANETSRQQRLYVYTDRPIYRPGHTVQLRALLRNEDDARYTLPAANTRIAIGVYDPNTPSAPIYETTLQTDGNGVATASFALKAEAGLGNYTIALMQAKTSPALVSSGFSVAAYRPVDHEVTFAPAPVDTVIGDSASTSINARYLFGAALKNAPVNWKLTATPGFFRPANFDTFTFGESNYNLWDYWWRPQPTPINLASGSGNSDSGGKLAVTLPISAAAITSQSSPFNLVFEASATSPSAQVVAGRSTFTAHPARYYVGVALANWFLTSGQPNAIDLVVLNWAGNRVGGKPIEVQIYRRDWQISPTTGDYAPTDELIQTLNSTSLAAGNARVNFTPPNANGSGTYRIVARLRDEQNRLAQTSLFAWAIGANERWFTGDKVAKLQLIPNKSEYIPGDTATILIPSPYKSPDDGDQYALITLERGHIYEQVVRRIVGSSLTYSFPISTDHAPNIFVSVAIFKGKLAAAPAAFAAGAINVRVKPSKQTLNVSVRGSQLAQPGDAIEYTIQVRDADGQPVSGQFSLDMVDKGVLNLKPRKEGELIDAFYSARAQQVQTAAGLAVALDVPRQGPLAEGTPVPSVVAAAPGTVRSDSAGSSSATNSVRENFQDTGYWSANINTDADGLAKVTIKLADNLTTWVLRAVGADARTRVGEGTAQLVTSKPVLLQPITPRFMVLGDVIELGTLVQNSTKTPQAATVWLREFGGLTLNSPQTQTVSVPAEGSATVRWQVTVLDATQADLIFAVQAGDYADATRPRLSTAPNGGIKILRYDAPDTVGTAGMLTGAGGRTEWVTLPPRDNVAISQGSLNVRLEPSLAAAVQSALTAVDYSQYGFKDCVECVLSELLPNVMHYAALREFAQRDSALEARLRGLISERLSQLYDMQNTDGGWGWRVYGRWESNSQISAYALFALARAKDAGFGVNANAIAQAQSYLQTQITPLDALTDPWRTNIQPFMLYALAESGAGRADVANALFAQRAKLDLHGQALLTLAIGKANAKDARLATLLAELGARAIASATGMHWENKIECWLCMSSNTHATALVLSALARHDVNNALAPNAVRWLMSNRVQNQAWRSSYETAWVLVGLVDWLRASHETRANYSYGALLNGVTLAQGSVNASNLITPVLRNTPISALRRSEANTLLIERGDGEGRLYYTAHLNVGLPAGALSAANRGIGLQRRFVAADCSAGAACAELRQVRVGDLLRVQLSLLAPSDLYHVELTDMLPAGMEIVDVELATTPSAVAVTPTDPNPGVSIGRPIGPANPAISIAPCSPWWCWRWNWYGSQQFRDDRVTLFASSLGRGSYTYSYVVRATLPGTFQVIPASARERYFPEVFGRSAGAVIVVKE